MDNVHNEQVCRSDSCKKQSKACRHDARVAVLTCKKDVESELLRMGVSRAGTDIMSSKGVFRTVVVRDVPIKAA